MKNPALFLILPLLTALLLPAISQATIPTSKCASDLVEGANNSILIGYIYQNGFEDDHKITVSDFDELQYSSFIESKVWRNGSSKQKLETVMKNKNMRLFSVGYDSFLIVGQENPRTKSCVFVLGIFDWAE